MTSEQAAVILNAMALPSLHAEQPVTKRVIDAIPPAKADYQPDAISRSAIELAWHIVTAESRFLEAVINGAFDLTPMPRPDSVRTPADVVAWYGDRAAKNVSRLKSLSGEQLTNVIDFRGLFQFPAVVYLPLALNHTIHHRGQLSMYLRPMGAKVPSIYGESYDAREARERRERSPA
jgi:uncharacterized damage-inducible protein DinB